MSETETLALSELRTLIVKAARGAGLSWGLAEEAGWAAEWLARRGMPAADWATLWLAARLEGAVSPVEVGVLLADEISDDPLPEGKTLPDGIIAPGYLLPFLHRMAQGRASLAIRAACGPVALLSDGAVTFGPLWAAQSCGWSLVTADDTKPDPQPAARPTVSKSVLECLEGLALRTTVPPSALSRSDAGSSGGDND